MKDYLKYLEEAERFLKTAESLLNLFNNFNEPKVLLAVVDNLFIATTKALSAFSYYNLYYKKIDPFKDDFNTKYNILVRLSSQYNIKDYDFLIDLKEIVVYHKKSKIEFERNNSLYMCIDDYNDCKKINLKILKDFIIKAKLFISQINSIVK